MFISSYHNGCLTIEFCIFVDPKDLFRLAGERECFYVLDNNLTCSLYMRNTIVLCSQSWFVFFLLIVMNPHHPET